MAGNGTITIGGNATGNNINTADGAIQINKSEIKQQEAKTVGNDYSGMTTHVHDNANVIFGDVSGTVAQTINQLPEESNPDKETLKTLLTKLQKLIEKAEELEQGTKIDALNQIKTLAKVGANPNAVGGKAAISYFEELATASIASAIAPQINQLLLGITSYLPK